MPGFEDQIKTLDIHLFDGIYSQLYKEDKVSLLVLQKGVREKWGSYCYLEIGSYAGGSIQPHLLDAKCTRIYSIDNRPRMPADDRGIVQEYPDNSTEMMMKNLAGLSSSAIHKVRTFEDDAANIAPGQIAERPQFCFIDGEHTHQAVISDFSFCKSVLDENGIICFHDSNIIFTGLNTIVNNLKSTGVKFRAYVVPLNIFVIEFGNVTLCDTNEIRDMLDNNHVAYLSGMLSMEHYRKVYNSTFVKSLRTVKGWMKSIPGFPR